LSAWFYILRLRSGRLYVGSTSDLDGRLADHTAGKGGTTTHDDPPERLVYQERYPTVIAARRREAQVKRWSRAKKESLVAGDRTALRQLAISRDHQPPTGTPSPQDRYT
jgi:putative endonuclease